MSGTARLPTPGSIGAWVLASRPQTLTVALAPVLLGGAFAVRMGLEIDATAWLLALTGALFIQIGTNFANDVFDHEKGSDRSDRLGPPRAAQMGLLRPSQLRWGMWVTFAAAALCGAALTVLAGWPVVVIGVLSIASGIAYTGGPYPLGYNGLGDLFVFVFFGLVAVAGTFWVSTGVFASSSLVLGMAPGALATAILVVNNLRDEAQDRISGKRTLVVRLGRSFGIAEYRSLVLLAQLTPIALWLQGLGYPVLLPLFLTPWMLAPWTRIARDRGAELNPLLPTTARLLFVHAILLAAGLVSASGSG